jgi:hypothetical protein
MSAPPNIKKPEITPTPNNSPIAPKSAITLVDILSQVITNEISFSFKVSPLVIVIISKIIILCPESINNMTDCIKLIIQDGVINEKDIPQIVMLFVNLHNVNFRTLIKGIQITTDNIIELLQVLIKTVIEFNLIKVSNKESVYLMIDQTTILLETIISPIELNCSCFGFCK